MRTVPIQSRGWCLLGFRDGRIADPDGASDARWLAGELRVLEERDSVLARTVMIARLAGGPGEVAPPLLDARLIRCDDRGLLLIGFERDPLVRRDAVQSWLYLSPEVDRYWCQAIRRAGVPVPRWQQHQRRWVRGRLALAEERDDLRQRSMSVARFTGVAQETELFAPLLDAKLIQLTGERLVLTGFERATDGGSELAQTWLLMHTSVDPRGAGHGD